MPGQRPREGNTVDGRNQQWVKPLDILGQLLLCHGRKKDVENNYGI
jgi:hypothetical protein